MNIVSDCIACVHHPVHWVAADEDDERITPFCEMHYQGLLARLSEFERRSDEMIASGVHPEVASRILLVEMERAA